MAWTSDNWPIGPSLGQFPSKLPDGTSLADAPAEQWEKVAREIAHEGFAHFDLFDTWIAPAELTTERRSELRDAIERSGLTISAISTSRRSPASADPDEAARNLAYLHDTIDIASEFGVDTICMGLHEPLTPEQEAAEWFWHVDGRKNTDDPAERKIAVDAFKELGSHAASNNIQLSLEIYEDTYLGTSDSAVQFIEEIGLANVGLNPDIGNVLRLHRPMEDWKEFFEKTLPYTNYWHMKNYIRDFDVDTGAYFTSPTSLELGMMDFRWAIGRALDHGFNGPICIEQYGGDVLSVAGTGMRYVRKLLDAKLSN